ncbi:MAG TPA: carboxypeptidase regulatory-like domain-containing protein, partial [Vicinamibacterales bacterium]|nr:carboxypeptidase regulatory-like domain-containing protein [Vicinamibacterales bacterium]
VSLVAACVLVPVASFAQASLAGVVKDSSGAVLPGVTVEASSPALIEKTRSAITDGSGEYRLEQLRPGTYSITFSLTGFTTVKREGIELSGSFTATINAELRVGSVAETVTVTGASPLVDVQGVAKERVLPNQVLTDIPTGRTQFTVTTLIPGMNLNNQDVGGTNIINTTGGAITVHGSSINDQRVMIDGLSTANAEGSGYASNFLPNFGSVQEVAVDYASGTAEQGYGGVRINLVPREGGNDVKGSFFATAVNSSFQGSNYTPDLIARGLTTPNSINAESDVNPGLGGPIVRDQLWFYASARWVHTSNFVGGIFNNLNAGDPNNFAYRIDPTNQNQRNRGLNNSTQRSYNIRLTLQATPRNKFNFFVDDQSRCQCANVNATTSPEAANDLLYPIQRMATIAWTSPVTSRLLLEARGGFRGEHYEYSPTKTNPNLNLIPVTELGGPVPGILYHGTGLQTATQPYQNTYGRNFEMQASASYITGAHAFKVGFYDMVILRRESLGDDNAHVSYTFNSPNTNPTVPNPTLITERTTPYLKSETQPADIALYAQDKWTLRKLTLNAGLRFEYLDIVAPALTLGPAPLVPNRNLNLPETPLTNFKDVMPRVGGVYDVFGNGKTAVRASLNRYVIAQGVQGSYGDSIAPVNRLANTVTRSWTDANHNLIPDCDLTNVQANGECGKVSDTNFGSPTASTALNGGILNGWGVRPYNWEFSTGLQQQVLPRVAVDLGYFRRWYGNFAVTVNQAVNPSSYSTFGITAPNDPRLPDAGQPLTGLFNLVPSQVGNVSNYFTGAGDFGSQIQHWNGFDLSLNARLLNNVLLQGGISSGKTVTDNCGVVAQHPDLLLGATLLGTANANAWLPEAFCHQESPFLTQVKFLGSYTVPRVDVQFSGSFQSLPGPMLVANAVLTNALVQPLLGRPLSGSSTMTVEMIPPGSEYGDRLYQLDMRFAKLLKFSGLRTSVNLDVYNLFNGNPVLTENSTYTLATSTWRVPTSILTARFAKISLQVDF